MKNKFIIAFLLLLMPGTVKASSYTTTENLFENTYTNNLIDMAQSQIDNITNKSYAIIQVNYDYYFIAADKKDVTVSGSTLVMGNTTIIRAIRNQSSYSSYYTYDTLNEANTTIYANNIIVSNIDTSKSVSSKRFIDYLTNKNTQILLMFILGLVFAIFLTKERNY